MLKGSLPFMADLMRAITLPLRIDLMEVSSYGGTATESSGLVRIIKDLSASIAGEDVLLVEDIIDTGLTLNYLVRYLRGKNPASLRICTLLDKPARRLVDIPVDYIGFEIPDQFVVGYGLDYGERYRNLRFVGVLRPEVYSGARVPMHADPRARPTARRSSADHPSSAACCRGTALGGDGGLPATYNAFDGTGIVVFLAALATLALVALPYAAGDRPMAIDRGLASRCCDRRRRGRRCCGPERRSTRPRGSSRTAPTASGSRRWARRPGPRPRYEISREPPRR